jgi:predicted GIY-YIG superfamily endonuclease
VQCLRTCTQQQKKKTAKKKTSKLLPIARTQINRHALKEQTQLKHNARNKKKKPALLGGWEHSSSSC